MDAERLSSGAEVGEAPERITAHEDPLLGKPERDLLPEPASDDGQHHERCTRHVGERRDVERDAEPVGDRCVVALVAVDELDDSGRLAERANPLVEAGAVDHVRQPDAPLARTACEVRCRRSPSGLQPNPCSNSSLNRSCMGTLLPVAEHNGTSNAEIAERLEAFASLLDLAGASQYTARAYRRAAELIRETPAPIAELVRAGRVRELRGIGPGIEARLRELVETGRIAELDELEREVPPELVGLGRFLGLGAQAGGRDRAGARRAHSRTSFARRPRPRGGCARCRGSGPKTEAKLLAALGREARPRPRRGMLLNRARALLEADRGGARRRGRRRPAALARRERGARRRLRRRAARRRCSSASSGCRRSSRSSSASERRAVGVTVEGVPGRARRRRARSGSGPSSCARPARASTSRRSSRCRTRPTRRASTARSASRCARPSCASSPSAASRRRSSSSPTIRGDLHCHTTWSDGKASVLEMGEAARERGYEYLAICDHTRERARRPGPRRRRRAAPGRGDRRGERAARAVPRSCAGSSATSSPTARSTSPTTCSPSSTGCRRASTPASARPRRELTSADGRGDAASGGALRSATRRGGSSTTGRRTRSTWSRCSRSRSRRGVALEVNGLPRPARPARRARAARGRGRACRSSARPTRTPCAGSGTCAWRWHGAARLGDGRRRAEHAPPVRNRQALS